MSESEEYIAALITLHLGLERQGPGDEQCSRDILAQLPALSEAPLILDAGCGTGAAALLLAAYHSRSRVIAIDLSNDFLDTLRREAERRGLGVRLRCVHGDMLQPAVSAASLDLIWSEGAVYAVGFERALRAWKALLKPYGLVVVSEMSWFSENIPTEASDFWRRAYPGMETEEGNRCRAEAAGYRVLATRRLPTEAWWDSYYSPLLGKLDAFADTTDSVLRAVLEETREEITLFRRYAQYYGYTFYILQSTAEHAGGSR